MHTNLTNFGNRLRDKRSTIIEEKASTVKVERLIFVGSEDIQTSKDIF